MKNSFVKQPFIEVARKLFYQPRSEFLGARIYVNFLHCAAQKDLVVNNILLLPLNPFAVGCNMEHLAGHVDHTMGKKPF